MANVISITRDTISTAAVPTVAELLQLKQKLDLNIRLAVKKAREADTLKGVLIDAYEQSKHRVDELIAENERLRRQTAKLRNRVRDSKLRDDAPRRTQTTDDFEDQPQLDDDHVGSTTDVDVECGYNLKGF